MTVTQGYSRDSSEIFLREHIGHYKRLIGNCGMLPYGIKAREQTRGVVHADDDYACCNIHIKANIQ